MAAIRGPRVPQDKPVQAREGDHHPVGRCPREQEQRDGVPDHAAGRDHPLARAVSGPAPAQVTPDLRDREQGHHRRRLRERVPEPLRDVRDHVHDDRRHDEQGGAVAERDQPERGGAHGLAGREVNRGDDRAVAG